MTETPAPYRDTPPPRRIRIPDLQQAKRRGERWAMLTGLAAASTVVAAGALAATAVAFGTPVFHGSGAYSVVTNTRFNGFGEMRQLTVMGFD